MVDALLGRKLGMTQIFVEGGIVQPVTVLQMGPCVVTQHLTQEKNGYSAVQIGFEEKTKKINKPEAGHYGNAGVAVMRNLAEVRLEKDPDVEVGSKISCDIFEAGQRIDVTGTTKGRGFAGTIKRHNFSRGPETHGSMNVRQPGSIGMCAYPGRVFKGKKMPGHMGHRKLTQRGLTIVKVDAAKDIIMVRGAVPGPRGGLIRVRKAVY